MKANEWGWSLSKQQQVRQEKQARGTWGVQPPRQSASLVGNSAGSGTAAHAASNSDPELGSLFTGLLLEQADVRGSEPPIQNDVKPVRERTNPINFAHKKQESTVQRSNASESATQFELDVDSVGRVLVSAVTVSGRLQVSLQFPGHVPLNARDMLTRLLNVRLSNTVGVPVEVKIGS